MDTKSYYINKQDIFDLYSKAEKMSHDITIIPEDEDIVTLKIYINLIDTYIKNVKAYRNRHHIHDVIHKNKVRRFVHRLLR